MFFHFRWFQNQTMGGGIIVYASLNRVASDSKPHPGQLLFSLGFAQKPTLFLIISMHFIRKDHSLRWESVLIIYKHHLDWFWVFLMYKLDQV
jgi:hypothetical protein